MNTKQQLLQNPLVKEIAEAYRYFNSMSARPDDIAWERFVKSNEPVREWEILELDESFHLNGTNTPSLYFKAAVERGAIIKAVRRVSDGEIFVVGDEVETPAMKMKIVDLFLSENGQIYFNGSYLLHGFQKARTPLFVTKDNKEIFNGDECFWVNPFWGIEKGVGGEKHMSQVNSFSTEQAATEYITLNKPCLSVQDVNELLIKKHFMDEKAILQKVIELAKSKQNNS